jgi:hypothetical protein
MMVGLAVLRFIHLISLATLLQLFFKLPLPQPFLQPSFLCFPQFGSQARYVLCSLHDLCLLVFATHTYSYCRRAFCLGRPRRSRRIQLLDLSHILEGGTTAFMETSTYVCESWALSCICEHQKLCCSRIFLIS